MGLLVATSASPIDAASLAAHAIVPVRDVVLVVRELVGDAVVLGRFQRARSAVDVDALRARGTPIVRRTAGGPALRVGEGMLHVCLRLPSPASLGGVDDVQRAFNRHVRPLLRALESLGAPATWGGRDVVLMRGVPVVWLGLGHSAHTRAMELEAIVAVTRDFALPSELDLARAAIAPRFLGRAPGSLAQVLGGAPRRSLVSALVAAYESAVGLHAEAAGEDDLTCAPLALDLDEQPFAAMVEEAIGLVGARHEPEHRRVAIGGDLGASEDALEALERALHREGAQASEPQLGALVDAHFGPSSGAATFGVKSLRSIAKAAFHALNGA